MWNIELRPEIKKELKDPEGFAKGLGWVYNGLTICMAGVGMMAILYFTRPQNVLHPTWIILLGFAIVAVGEWKKFRSK
ncbi:MAG: hypothetical protein GWM98_23890 [Nitrospinaceae bacterium]|nr:hypothetical protein [Nitrospinaceae bacterium]NIR56946.1 hypothetical protein [Nitrospinaceae bacterium]NIS87402.1 hypothetical protein [Nitrospinaceae bacterium]NIT84254.1 hypothetical protein [Nitrospinaceae bacterium]NIU46442.1 hypothetical protein [Nitrospinaceae bacterium]